MLAIAQAVLTTVLCIWVPTADEPGTGSRTDILFADFESQDYGNWTTTGDAFGHGPARGTLPGQMAVSGFLGHGLVNSFLKGDGTTGTLTSAPFRIERPYLNFLIGGGKYPGKTCMNLLVEGKNVRTATGPNDQQGGSEQLIPESWDVREFVGKTATIQIVDQHQGGWGHINVDHIVQSDRQIRLEPASREIGPGGRYLLFPVKTGASKQRLAVKVGGRIVREFEIELALPSGSPDFHAPLDLGAWRDQAVELVLGQSLDGAKRLERIQRTDDSKLAARPVAPRRPGIHFTAPVGWLNDPNGLVYLDGVWHLFYQHNPYGWAWGNMHWGHAISSDLIRWEDRGEALYPKQFGDWAFSGSAVVDVENTSKWKQGETPLLILAYTSTGRGECIAYSRDRGETWTEYEGNPVVRHAGRDPRLVWHAPTKQWVMAVYDEWDGKRWIAFHTSHDLKSWTFQSRIEGFFECPDLFELPVSGSLRESRWILYAADGQYVIGKFDGKTFQPEHPGKKRLWYGNFYAAQTYSNAPDNRRIQIGWGQGIEFRGASFNQQMTIPVELKLTRDDTGLHLRAEPVAELTRYEPQSIPSKPATLGKDHPELSIEPTSEIYEIDTQLGVSRDAELAFEIQGLTIVYDARSGQLRSGKVIAALPVPDRSLRFRIIVDRGSVEVFADSGRVAMSLAAPAGTPMKNVALKRSNGDIQVRSLAIHPINP